MTKPKSIFWALQAVFWYWWDHGVPLTPVNRWCTTAWWHGFYMRKIYNEDPMLLEDEITVRDAVSEDVSCWEP